MILFHAHSGIYICLQHCVGTAYSGEVESAWRIEHSLCVSIDRLQCGLFHCGAVGALLVSTCETISMCGSGGDADVCA